VPGATALRRLLLANLVAQVGIVLTGGVVRLTGSGLGCPTFPECVRGSVVPVKDQTQGFHKFIEFGNRMLVMVVTGFAVATLLAVWRYVRGGGFASDHPRARPEAGRRLIGFSAVPFLGVVAQALIGGISVLTKLNPAVVALHFLVSMALIAGSTLLVLFAVPPAALATARRPAALVRGLLAAAGLALTVVLALGTTVTGSGPHSGDTADAKRFDLDIATMAHLHSGAVWVFLVLVVLLLAVLRGRPHDRTAAPGATRWALAVLGLTLAQGVIGYVQYALAVPAQLVALHMLGASLLTAATTVLAYAVLNRGQARPAPRWGDGGTEAATPAPSPARA
jgi:cytochrome c oxidase assembly protein subunit 15